jgi:hypothetical protein
MAINVFVFMQPALASTFVTKESPTGINQFISQTSRTNVISNLKFTLGENMQVDATTNARLRGYPSWYNKRITEPIDLFSPCYLNQQMNFIVDSNLRKEVLKYPPIVLINSNSNELNSSSSIDVKKFSIQAFHFLVRNQGESRLGIFQNHYIHWRAYVDEKEVPVELWNKSFMSVNVPDGQHEVSFEYKPVELIRIMIICLVTWILALSYVAYHSFKKKNL